MKSMLSVMMFLVFTGMSSIVYAHPASDLVLKFDPKVKVLSVDIQHQVSDPTRHYIKQVDITLNGQRSISHSLTSQATAVGETLSYALPDVKDGDVIAVDTNCNKGGSLKKEITARLQ